jgi:ATP-dependent Lon protease
MAAEQPEGDVLPVIALRNVVVFPGVVTRLRVGRPRSVAALARAREGDGRLALVTQRRAEVDEPLPEDLYEVGVISEVRTADGEDEEGVQVVVAGGVERCRILEYVRQAPHIAVAVEPLPDTDTDVPDDLVTRVTRLYAGGQEGQEGQVRALLLDALPEDARLDYVIAAQLGLPVEEQQRFLAERSRLGRYRMLVPLLEMAGEIARVGDQIWSRSRQRVGAPQRERYLRDRKAEVERQLKELSGEGVEVEELRRRIEEADLPGEALREAERELDRLGRMVPGQPEYAVAEDYLDWLLALPWHECTEATTDLHRAREVLDRDHYDRAEVKDRILEYLSVRKLNPAREGALLCLVGPPGVGKTSMGRAIAEATGRKFYRVSLGGIRDEAEIRGHRRTYLGSLPGCIIRALRRVGVNNPVLMLDEVDKLGGGMRGDPTGALLEVLDPEQNRAFMDNYIAVPFDLSRVMFIGTGNTSETIAPTLLDRLEVIELPGYTTEEKVAIARQYLVPKRAEAAGLGSGRLHIEPDALELLVERHTREAGVRNLERQIAAVCRKLARESLGAEVRYRHVDRARVEDLLGPPPYHRERLEKLGKPGVCPTLTISEAGAGLLLVEILRVTGEGKLIVTGRVGEVLRESASLAFGFWRARAERFGLEATVFRQSDFHVHFPGGGRAREGTAAGLPMALAFASLLSGACLPEGTAALGEITLHGRVLPVRHLPERVAAAERVGLTRVLLPERNRADVAGARDLELPAELELTYVSTVEEAVRAALPAVAAAGGAGR